jgi:hypothetical protein
VLLPRLHIPRGQIPQILYLDEHGEVLRSTTISVPSRPAKPTSEHLWHPSRHWPQSPASPPINLDTAPQTKRLQSNTRPVQARPLNHPSPRLPLPKPGRIRGDLPIPSLTRAPYLLFAASHLDLIPRPLPYTLVAVPSPVPGLSRPV